MGILKLYFLENRGKLLVFFLLEACMNYLCQTEIKREAAAKEVLVLPTKEPPYRTDLPKMVRNTEGLKVPA